MPTLKSIADTTVTWAEQRQIALQFEAQTTSTNDDAKKNSLTEPQDFTLYLTAHQTAGRGRGANSWLDTDNGESLLSTWSFALAGSPQAITGPRVGLALMRAVSSVWPSLMWSLKAPNDLFLGGRKVGGLLIESVSGGAQYRVMIGLGLNVLNHPRHFQQADHLSKSLNNVPDEGEWFQFLDELRMEFAAAMIDCQLPGLNDELCRELTHALNANPSKTFITDSVSAQGDLIHAGGKIIWSQL